MTKTNWYTDWFDSPFCHRFYFERSEKDAEAFIREIIKHLSPAPGSRVLDTACRTGEFSKILASLNFDVSGFDLSSESIACAKQYEHDRLHFFIHDMRLPFYSNYFDYAFNFFSGFGYYKTLREHDAAIRTIATSLKAGGYFVLDYLNVHYEEQQLIHNETKEIGGTRYEIHRWDDDNHFHNRIIITDPSLIQPQEFTEEIAKFSLGDFNDMFSYHGMQIHEVFGDYHLNSYDVKKTPRLILIAQKK
jgi:SAM-dependent methyltransferase